MGTTIDLTESVAGEEDPGASVEPALVKPDAAKLASTPRAAARRVCPRCAGSGKLGASQCPYCGGTGEVIAATPGG